MTKMLKLGLIGDNIERSHSPLLHRLAGEQCGVEVSYDRLVPKDLARSFSQILADCPGQGFRGINITYPYKEIGANKVRVDDPLVGAIGAVNTVVFDGEPIGHNTDYSGFISTYRKILGDAPTGPVLMIGTGGVGRAVAFALAGLGTKDLRLVDRDITKAESLARALQAVAPDMDISIWINVQKASRGAKGLINCTPIGMLGKSGTPLGAAEMEGAEWAFDAVYTPSDTQFLADATVAGLTTLSGWELFFFQGVHAWSLFSGMKLDEDRLHEALLNRDTNA